MTDNERAARAAEAERIWHDAALGWLADGNVDRAVACLHEYAADLDVIAAQ